MQAFHNDEKVKLKYVTRMQNHIASDNLVRGIGWEGGKGCAVGCTLEKHDHSAYETELGVPEWLANLEDTLFENMTKERAMRWPLEFLETINIGSDLEKVKTPFLIFILEQNIKTLDSFKVDEKYKDIISAIEQTKAATQQMIEAHKNGADLSAAESAAWSAAWSAWSAAWSAAESARSAAYEKYADKLLELIKGCE